MLREGEAKPQSKDLYLPNILSLQFCRNKEFLRGSVIFNAQHIRLAAHLAVFHIALPPPGRLVDRSSIPFSASSALETGFHGESRQYDGVAGQPASECNGDLSPIVKPEMAL